MATVSHDSREDAAPWQTHTVFNQVPPLADLDVFASNLPLVEAVEREGAGWVGERASALGRLVGGEPQQLWGRLANENKPILRTFDRCGNRIDEVEFHPAWHSLMALGVEHELHSLPWTSEEPAAHAARAAMYMTAMQAEAGFACPITMTFAVVPALRAQPELAAEWEPLVTATSYDPRLIPAGEKGSAIAGMAMTEKQGGSDVRANTTFATPLNGGGAGGEYELIGHKWFCSAPMSDFFLVLAQTDDGLSCFLLPRILPDGGRNAFHIQRLKGNVLADLCVESEAATALAMRLARAYDEAHADADAGADSSDAQLFKRLATAVGKYWTCKRAPNHAFEALECLGGAGYVEESGMPRLYREAPLASIWEGSGNVMSLDVLRALTRSPRSLEVFVAEVEQAAGADARLDRGVQALKQQFADPATLETRARRVVESMALCLQGSLLVRHAPAAVADAFCASRLGGDGGLEYGTLPAGVDFASIIERAAVHA